MRVNHYVLAADSVPVDFFADPDGDWSYESLLEAAGFHPEAADGVLIGALARPWGGHPDGAAVVVGPAPNGPRLCIVECGRTNHLSAA